MLLLEYALADDYLERCAALRLPARRTIAVALLAGALPEP